jgi:hypothetical protein
MRSTPFEGLEFGGARELLHHEEPPPHQQVESGPFREPHGQAPALPQGDVIGGPIRHSVPLLRDVMTAILVRFEWHGDCPRSGTGPPSYTVHSSPPTTDPCNKVSL